MQHPGLFEHERPAWLTDEAIFDVDEDWERLVTRLKSSAPPSIRVPFMVPDLPPSFILRPEVQDQVRRLLLQGSAEDVSVALVGAAGTGKTTVAAAACTDDEVVSRFRGGIVWLKLDGPGNPQQSATLLVKELAQAWEALTGETATFQSDIDGASRFAALVAGRGCLVVFDGVPRSPAAERLLSTDKRFPRLITTRDVRVARMARANVVTVGNMDPVEARQLLLFGLQDASGVIPFSESLISRFSGHPLLMQLLNADLRSGASARLTPDGLPQLIDEDRRRIALSAGSSLNELTTIDQQRYRALALLSPEEMAQISSLIEPNLEQAPRSPAASADRKLLDKLQFSETKDGEITTRETQALR